VIAGDAAGVRVLTMNRSEARNALDGEAYFDKHRAEPCIPRSGRAHDLRR
jgi:hypothetical protein